MGTMRVGIFLLLISICHAELQQGQRIASENAAEDVLKEEVRSHYSGGTINKPQTRAGKLKQLAIGKKKALAKARAKNKASSAGSTQGMDSSIASQVTNSNATQVIIEPDTPLASLWYPPPSNPDGWKEFFKVESERKGVKNSLPSPDTQCVYLDFNQRAPYSVRILNIAGVQVGEFGPFHGYHYNKLEQEAILDRLNRDYHLYNVKFTLEKPDEDDEPYTTIQFNANDFPNIEYAITAILTPSQSFGFRITFGLAPGIDYLNLIRDDLVRVQGNFWSFLVEIDPTGALFTLYSGIPYLPDGAGAVSFATINQSSNTASHELGHALGLRHHDAFGSPGDGLPITGRPSVNDYYAPYPGPVLADESTLHLMASGAVLGPVLDLSNQAQDDRFFSERSSVKLSFAEGCGHFMTEKEAKEYRTVIGGMEIPEFFVQNPVMVGENAGGRYLRIDSVNIAGSIEHKNEVDGYRLFLKENRVFSAEIISYTSTLRDRVMTTLTLLKVSDDGRREVVAANDFGFEGFDPHIIDFKVRETGTYVLAVAVQQTIPMDRDLNGSYDELVSVKKLGGEDFLTGEYNLLIYNHHDPIQKARYRPDDDVCMNTKKKGYGSSSYHSGDYYSHDYSDYHSGDEYDHSDESHSESHSEGYSDHTDNDRYDEDAKNLRGTPSSENKGNPPVKWGHE